MASDGQVSLLNFDLDGYTGLKTAFYLKLRNLKPLIVCRPVFQKTVLLGDQGDATGRHLVAQL